VSLVMTSMVSSMRVFTSVSPCSKRDTGKIGGFLLSGVEDESDEIVAASRPAHGGN
jgi:hypothetical protein